MCKAKVRICEEKLVFLLFCHPDRCDREEIVLGRNVRSNLSGALCEHTAEKNSAWGGGMSEKTASCVYCMFCTLMKCKLCILSFRKIIEETRDFYISYTGKCLLTSFSVIKLSPKARNKATGWNIHIILHPVSSHTEIETKRFIKTMFDCRWIVQKAEYICASGTEIL